MNQTPPAQAAALARQGDPVLAGVLVAIAVATVIAGLIEGLLAPPAFPILAAVFFISVSVTAVYQIPTGRAPGPPGLGVAAALLVIAVPGTNPLFDIGVWVAAFFVSKLVVTRSPWMAAQWAGQAAVAAVAYVFGARALVDVGVPGWVAVPVGLAVYFVLVLAVEFLRSKGRWSRTGRGVGLGALSPARLALVWGVTTLVALLDWAISEGYLQVLVGADDELELARETIPLLIVALVFYALAKRRETRISERRLNGIVDAARALPWNPEDDLKNTMMSFAERAVDAAVFTVRRTPPGRNEIGAKFTRTGALIDPQLDETPYDDEDGVPGEHQEDAVEPVEYLVAMRKDGGVPFSQEDERALDAIGHIASETARVRGAYDLLLDRVDRDSLTGLPNYNAFQRSLVRLNEDRQYASGLAVLFIDLDQFKRLNDTEGHHVGDEMLATVATRLRASVRPHDFVARVGGDEFVAILTKLQSLAESKAIADRIVANLSKPVLLDGREYRPLVSVGLAFSAAQETDPRSIVVDADHSMLSIKRSRRQGGPSFESSIGISPHRSSRINEIVAKAIDDGTLNVVYQPIVNMAEDRIWAFESLVRYTHPELGRISTSSLIEKAKGLGRMDQLTKLVISASLKSAREFQRLVPSVRTMTINLEVEQIRDEHVGGFLKDIVPQYPEITLCLELNERSTKDIDDELRAQAEVFREMGMLIALDDYGSEASSVGALVSIPMDILKIDRSLAGNLDDTRQREVVRALQGFSDAFEYSTIVEGVEAQEQAEILLQIGVKHAQGFFYGRPVPFAQTMSRLKNSGDAGTLGRPRLAERGRLG